MSIPDVAVRFTASNAQFESVVSQVRGSLVRLGGVMAGVFAADKIKDFAVDSVKTFADADRIWNNLAGSLANAGVQFSAVESQINAAAVAMQAATTVGDEDFASTLQTLVAISNDYEGSMRNVQVAADLAAGAHISMDTAADLVGKAMVGNTATLSRYGIVVRDSDNAVAAIQERFRGMAANEVNTLDGRMKQLNNAWGDFQEAIGRALVGGDDLGEVVFNLTERLKKITAWIDENGKSFVDVFRAANTGLRLLVATLHTYATDLATIYLMLQRIASFRITRNGIEGSGPSLKQIIDVRQLEMDRIWNPDLTIDSHGVGGKWTPDAPETKAMPTSGRTTPDSTGTAEVAAKAAAKAAREFAEKVARMMEDAVARTSIHLAGAPNIAGVGLNEDGRQESIAARQARDDFRALGGRDTLVDVPTVQREPVQEPSRLRQAAGFASEGKFGSAAGALGVGLAPLAAAALALKPVFDGLRESIAPVLSALAEPLETVGRLLGSMLAPALHLLQKPLELLAKAASYVVQGLGTLVYALAKAIDAIIPFGDPLKGLERYGKEMIAGAKAARKGLENVGDAADKVAGSLQNVPNGFKVALARFNASLGVGAVGSGGSGGSGSSAGGNAPRPPGHIPAAPESGNISVGDINIYGSGDPAETYAGFRNELIRKTRNVGGDAHRFALALPA